MRAIGRWKEVVASFRVGAISPDNSASQSKNVMQLEQSLARWQDNSSQLVVQISKMLRDMMNGKDLKVNMKGLLRKGLAWCLVQGMRHNRAVGELHL